MRYTLEELEVIAMTLDKLYEDSRRNYEGREEYWEVLERIKGLSEKTKEMYEEEEKRVMR